MEAEVRLIGPKEAEELLRLNTNNRSLMQNTVETYARRMADGLWQENGESIVITDKPRLGSGQHRLNAIIRSGKSYRMVIVTGVPDDAFPTLDLGRKRSAGDVLFVSGVKNGRRVAAAYGAISQYDCGSWPWRGTSFATPDQILKLRDKYGEIDDIVAIAQRIHEAAFVPGSVVAGVIYWMRKISREKTDVFCEKLLTSIGLTESDPERLLLSRMSSNRSAKSKLPINEIAALVAIAASARLKGLPVKTLRWDNARGFPRITDGEIYGSST